MGKKATKAADNIYYIARSEALSTNPELSSREKTAELLGIDRTRLARIELGSITPYPEEVKAMAAVYNMPELCNTYCAKECPLGRGSVKEVTIDDFYEYYLFLHLHLYLLLYFLLFFLVQIFLFFFFRFPRSIFL